MLLQHSSSGSCQCLLCLQLGLPVASATFQLWSAASASQKLSAVYLQASKDSGAWPEISNRLANLDICQSTRGTRTLLGSSSSLCSGAAWPRLPARHLLFILPSSCSERCKRRRFQALAGEASGNSSCSLAGSRPSWRGAEQFQMRVRKQRANVDSFAGGGVVSKARSDCFAAELNVRWTRKTPYSEGSRVWGRGKSPLKIPGSSWKPATAQSASGLLVTCSSGCQLMAQLVH